MVEPQPCVVEVTRIVPAEDVPYVAARVAERLGMPLERVRKLIEGRTGPITRPLRPDKAEAIAQTFEAAGVSVVIRPATDEDAVAPGPGPAPAPAPTAEADDAPDDVVATGDEGFAAATEHADEAEASGGPRPPDASDQRHPVPTDLGTAPDHDAWDDIEPSDADADDEGHGVVMEVDDAEDDADADVDDGIDAAHVADGEDDVEVDIEVDPRSWLRGGTRLAALDPERSAPVALDPDDDDETNDPGPFGLPARGEVQVRIEHDPDAATPASGEPAGAGIAGVRDAPFRAPGGPAVLADDPSSDPPIGRSPRSDGEAAPFGDPATWGGDDPSGGWIVGARTRRRLEVLHDDEAVSELPDAAPHDADDVDASAAAPTDGVDDAASPPWRGQPGIGRAYRRPQDAPGPPPGGTMRVEHDVYDEYEEDDGAGAPHGDDAPDAMTQEHGAVADAATPPATPLDDARRDAGDDRVDVVVVPPAPARRAVPMPPMRAPMPTASGEAAGATPVESPGQGAGRTVPTAWRGLGSDDRGPARPVDARLPTREERSFDERVRVAATERVTRRRTVMLIALAVALALFVLAQVWVAGRASPAFDAGLHRFRDADFGAAQRVWVQLAEHGDANAQFMLGYLSEAGLGRPWSARAAASWYRLAADAGHAEARWRLGSLYAVGLGVPHDPVDAMRWWAAAADAGHAEAAFRLGRARLEGDAGVSDAEGALAAFERAVALGWPAARPYRDALVNASSGGAHPGALP